MRTIFAAIAMCLCVSADEPKKDDKRKAIEDELQKFAGTWDIVTKGVTGEAQRAVFNKDGTYAACDEKGKELWKGTFDLDPTARPKVWDHRKEGEPKKTGQEALGIYELDGDNLKVCITVGAWKDGKWVGAPRPKEFKNTNDYTVVEMKRVK
jgi:uncharacterized protein (TIGR03067 family)